MLYYKMDLFLSLILVFSGFFIGAYGTLIGVGGGFLLITILSVITFFASLTHVIKGSLSEVWLKILILTIGVIPGAQLGAYLSSKMSERWIIRALTIAVAILGLRLIFLSL